MQLLYDHGTAQAHLNQKIRYLKGGSMESETAIAACAKEQSSGREDSWSFYPPDTLLMEEFFSARRGKTLVFPEERLMFAILEDALASYQQYCTAKHGTRRRLFQNVERWFFAPSRGWVFDFESICSVLRLEPDYVRKGLMQLRQRELTKTYRVSLMKTPAKLGRAAGRIRPAHSPMTLTDSQGR